MGTHDWRCGLLWGKGCICVDCAFDSYRKKSYIRCCDRRGRSCATCTEPCPFYVKESEEAPEKDPNENTEQIRMRCE